MAVVLDTCPQPRPGAYFWRYLRQLGCFLDTSNLNRDPQSGHPYFRTDNLAEHDRLVEESKENTGKFGKWKIELPRNFDFILHMGIKSKVGNHFFHNSYLL